MTNSRQWCAGVCLSGVFALGCPGSDEQTTIDTLFPMTDPDTTAETGAETTPGPDTSDATSEPPPTSTTGPDDTGDPTGDPTGESTSEPPPTSTTGPDETTTTSTTDPSETTTGGLPEGYLADEQRYPSDLVKLGDDLYWANNIGGDCVRRVSVLGGPVEDIACEPDDFYYPLQVVTYNGKIAWTYMSEGGGPQTLGFGGVRVSDGPGQVPQTLDDQARFKSSSSGVICNDTIAAEGDKLFWYSHILGGFNDGVIERWNGSKTDVFMAGSEFPYGVVTTPTTVHFSATEDYNKLALDAAANTPPTTVGMTQGSSCGRVAAGETLYVTSRGTFSTMPGLFVVTGGGVSLQRELDELAYDLSVDATHLYFAFVDRIDRVPLADLQNGAFETVATANVAVGGVLVDETNLYWTEYDYAGAVRVQPK
jgi:hypothetical protein